MADIEYSPVKKFVIHELKPMKPEDFFPLVATLAEAQKTGTVPSVYWLDSIAFMFGEFPMIPELIQEQLRGVVHKGAVYFTETSFLPEKRTSAHGRDVVVRMVKVENNPDFVNLVKFLKARKP